MDPDEQVDLDLDRLRAEAVASLDETLENGSRDVGELEDLARRHRAFAEATSIAGRRGAALTIAERLERAARNRAVASR